MTCTCQNQHRRGYCTEEGCPYSTPTSTRAAVIAAAERANLDDEWLLEGATIYALADDTIGRRKPIRTNTFWAGVQTSPGRRTEEQVRLIAEFIHAAQPRNILSILAADDRALAELREENERLTKLVQRFVRWADAKCPCENETPDPCPLCGASMDNLEPCKAADMTLPRNLLTDARSSLAALKGSPA